MLMCDATGLSQRRTCRLTGLSLSTCRYDAHRPVADAHLSGRITGLALDEGVLFTGVSGNYYIGRATNGYIAFMDALASGRRIN